MTALEALQRSPLFAQVGESSLKVLAEIAHLKEIPAGSPIFAENMVGDSMFVVCQGQVAITQKTTQGDKELARLGPGEHLGELALLARGVRFVSAVAATACEVVEITRREYIEKAKEKPFACLKVALAVAGSVAAKAGESRDALRELANRRP